MKYLPKVFLRDLMWLMIVAALAVGWWSERQYCIKAAKQAAKQNESERLALNIKIAELAEQVAIFERQGWLQPNRSRGSE